MIEVRGTLSGGRRALGWALVIGMMSVCSACGDDAAPDPGMDAGGEDAAVGDAGRAYTIAVARGSAYPKADNTGDGDRFGLGMAISEDGSTLAVGAGYEDSPATTITPPESTWLEDTRPDSGAVYVCVRSASGWTQQACLKAANAEAGDGFGALFSPFDDSSTSRALALAADGSTFAVAAHLEDSNATGIGGDPSNNTAVDSGAVYVY